jgi:hypothetical protein
MTKAQTAADWDDVLADLQARQQQRQRDDVVVDAELDELSFKAHLGDKKAVERLDKLGVPEAKRIEGALRVAEAERAKAEAAERNAEDREQARLLRASRREELQLCEQIDGAFELVVKLLAILEQQTAQSRALGAGSPNSDQSASYGTRCLLSWIGKVPKQWRRDVEVLPPGQRCGFSARWTPWVANDERAIAARLGEQQQDEEAAA